MSSLREMYLERLGIPVWELRRDGTAAADQAVRQAAPAHEPALVDPADADPAAAPTPVAGSAEASGVPAAARAAPAGGDDAAWETLRAEVLACTRCPLHRGRKQAVFGVGRRDATVMIVGEAPGAEEDQRGEPFVGRAGQLLNAMLRAIGFAREDVFIANVLKCRPPRNRDPSPDEAAACSDYLERQIALVRPQVMLAVGRISAQWLLQSDSPVGRLRGRLHRYGEVPLVVTYHPAYLLRSPAEKAKSWQDLCMVRSVVTAGQ